MRVSPWFVGLAFVLAACSGSTGDDSSFQPAGEEGGLDSTSSDGSESLDASNDDAALEDAPIDGAKSDATSDAKPDTGPAPFDPSSWKPKGKGLWIWYFEYTGMTAAEAAQKAKDIGAGYVLIKSGQDASFWSTRFTAAAVKEFTSRGMHVFAWPYVTPAGGTAAVDAAVQAANVPGCDGLVLDVEVEWEGGTHGAAATSLCKGIRSKKKGVWLGYTSFGWVGYHTSFPFKEFDADCGDSFWPQVYYSDRGVSWSYGYTQAIDMIKTMGLKAPVWTIQSNDNVYGTSSGPTTADLNSFFDKAGVLSSLWEFPSSSAPAKLTQLASLHFPNP